MPISPEAQQLNVDQEALKTPDQSQTWEMPVDWRKDSLSGLVFGLLLGTPQTPYDQVAPFGRRTLEQQQQTAAGEQEVAPQTWVTGGDVNIRTAPDTNKSSLYGDRMRNRYFQVLETVEGANAGQGPEWYKIQLENGEEAYVYAPLVTATEGTYDSSTNTVTPTAPPQPYQAGFATQPSPGTAIPEGTSTPGGPGLPTGPARPQASMSVSLDGSTSSEGENIRLDVTPEMRVVVESTPKPWTVQEVIDLTATPPQWQNEWSGADGKGFRWRNRSEVPFARDGAVFNVIGDPIIAGKIIAIYRGGGHLEDSQMDERTYYARVQVGRDFVTIILGNDVGDFMPAFVSTASVVGNETTGRVVSFGAADNGFTLSTSEVINFYRENPDFPLVYEISKYTLDAVFADDALDQCRAPYVLAESIPGCRNEIQNMYPQIENDLREYFKVFGNLQQGQYSQQRFSQGTVLAGGQLYLPISNR